MYAVLMALGYDSLPSNMEREKTLKTPIKKNCSRATHSPNA